MQYEIKVKDISISHGYSNSQKGSIKPNWLPLPPLGSPGNFCSDSWSVWAYTHFSQVRGWAKTSDLSQRVEVDPLWSSLPDDFGALLRKKDLWLPLEPQGQHPKVLEEERAFQVLLLSNLSLQERKQRKYWFPKITCILLSRVLLRRELFNTSLWQVLCWVLRIQKWQGKMVGRKTKARVCHSFPLKCPQCQRRMNWGRRRDLKLITLKLYLESKM